MGRKLQIKRGLEANLPTLAQAEFAMTTNTGAEGLHLGTGSGNIEVLLGGGRTTAGDVGAVPTTRKVNGKALSADVTLGAGDVGALPSTGGTLTGNLSVTTSGYPVIAVRDTTLNRRASVMVGSGKEVNISNTADANNKQELVLYPETSDVSKALRLFRLVSGTSSWYDFLHTGNKPTGSYTGNGDATERTIDTGGLGNVLYIVEPYGAFQAFVSGFGGIYFGGNDIKVAFGGSVAKFSGGVLTLRTDLGVLNGNGRTIIYQVL